MVDTKDLLKYEREKLRGKGKKKKKERGGKGRKCRCVNVCQEEVNHCQS